MVRSTKTCQYHEVHGFSCNYPYQRVLLGFVINPLDLEEHERSLVDIITRENDNHHDDSPVFHHEFFHPVPHNNPSIAWMAIPRKP
nr:hypothetical protein [Candidatus Sigynarchaeota archaeon]